MEYKCEIKKKKNKKKKKRELNGVRYKNIHKIM